MISILTIFYLYFTDKLLIPIILLFCLISLNITSHYPAHQAKIIEIGNGYSIGKYGHHKILLKNIDVNFDDVITFQGEIKEIDIVKSKYGFSFEEYLINQNIHEEVYCNKYQIIAQGNSIRHFLKKIIAKHPHQKLLEKILLNINHPQLQSALVDYSSFYSLKSIIRLVCTLLSLFLYSDKVDKIEYLLILSLYFLFPNYLIILRLLLPKMIRRYIRNNFTCANLVIIVLLIIDYRQIYQPGFVIYMVIKLMTSTYSTKKNAYIPLILIPMQLHYNNRIDLFTIALFPWQRRLNILLWLLGLIDIIFKSGLTHTVITFVEKIKFPELVVTGHISSFALISILILISSIISNISWLKIAGYICFFVVIQNQAVFNPFLTLTQLYVGQGDAAAIKMPYQREVLFLDVGSKFSFQKIRSYLDYYGIKHFSLIASHPDEDHVGNLAELLNAGYVLEQLHFKHVSEIDYHQLKLFQLNQNLYDNTNDNSLVLYFSINNYNFLYTGDISKKVEENLLKHHDNLKINVLKLGHHGSDTSTSLKLLSHQSLQLLLNSSGRNNLYGHPSHQVIKKINKLGLTLLDTQQVGDIQFSFLGQFSFININ